MPKAVKFIAAGVVAVIIAVVAVVVISSSAAKKNSEEALSAALPLVEANFDAVTYFKIAQLPPKPESEFSYENYPEGTVPCDTSIFANYAEFKAFVENTYIPDEAARLLSLKEGSTPRYFEANGELCKTTASPDLSYDKDFSNYSVKVTNATSKSADIIVTVSQKSGGTAEINLKMLKSTDGRWFLEKMEY